MADTQMKPSQTSAPDPFELRRHYEHLRVVDVSDALDGLGYFNLCNVDQKIRPLWLGMRFWGVAFTVRCVPANRPMWKLGSTEEIVDAHRIWFDEAGYGAIRFTERIHEGHVIVTDTGGADRVGFWGSENTLGAVRKGAVGIVTNGACRDTSEVVLQKTPVCARRRGQTIIPGRIEVVEVETPIGFGGVRVRPGDIIGCDDDGLVVVPLEVAREVAIHAREILLKDMRARKSHYESLDMPLDNTVDHDAVLAYYEELGPA